MARLRVSDRALVRWLERTGAMDVNAMRAMLADTLDRAAEAASVLDAGRFLIISDGVVFLVRNGAVVNVIEDDGRDGRRAALLRADDRP